MFRRERVFRDGVPAGLRFAVLRFMSASLRGC
jgi:hypothetical protein